MQFNLELVHNLFDLGATSGKRAVSSVGSSVKAGSAMPETMPEAMPEEAFGWPGEEELTPRLEQLSFQVACADVMRFALADDRYDMRFLIFFLTSCVKLIVIIIGRCKSGYFYSFLFYYVVKKAQTKERTST